MAASVAATAARRGHSVADIQRITRSIATAMEPRVLALTDDHHPAFLHPGRTALVLLHDVPHASAESVALASLIESRDPELGVTSARVSQFLGDQTAGAVADLPAPGAEDLTERLVTLEPVVTLAVLAERLDQLRHEHLREPTIPWAALVEDVEGAWLPVARRSSDALARRYEHWLRTFRRRL